MENIVAIQLQVKNIPNRHVCMAYIHMCELLPKGLVWMVSLILKMFPSHAYALQYAVDDIL